VTGPPEALRGKPIDHIGIAVRDLKEAGLVYETLGLSAQGEDETIASQAVRVRAYRAGDSLLELLEPTAEGPVAKFLERRGPGLHHLALRVKDLDAEIIRLKALGAPFISETPRPGRAGSRVVFLHPKWSQGVLIELVEHG
jgi:methylmalonyl-CoA/ethylmalonyl-CoA epimerase